MNRKRFVLPMLALLFVAAVTLTKCEGASTKTGSQDSASSHLNSPAPDNNSANNPSMADTAFQKDSTHKKHDSVK